MKTFIFIDFDFTQEQQQRVAAFTLRQSLDNLKDFYALAWIKQQGQELMASYWNRYDRPNHNQIVLEFTGDLPPLQKLDRGKTLALAIVMADMGLDNSLDADLDQLLDIINN